MNQRGFTLTSTLVGTVVGLIALSAIGTGMNLIHTQMDRIQRRMELQEHIQNIQHRSSTMSACAALFSAGQTLDLTKMQEKFSAAGVTEPGTPVTISLMTGETITKDSTFGQDGRLYTNHLALTDGEIINNVLGSSNFPIYQAILYGSFSYVKNNLSRDLASTPIAVVNIEINPTNNQIASCFSGSGFSQEQIDEQCVGVGGTWNTTTNNCDLTAPQPPPVFVPYSVWSGKGEASLGSGCKAARISTGHLTFYGSEINVPSQPAGHVQWIHMSYDDGSSKDSRAAYTQCLNGRWTKPVPL